MGLASTVVLSSVTHWVQDFWVFYRRYTDTTVHTASTAALAIFGILVFVDPWFAAVAIVCYVVPPIALYVLADDPIPGPERPVERRGSEGNATETAGRAVESVAARSNPARSSGDGDSRSSSSTADDSVGADSGSEDGTCDVDADSGDDGDIDTDSGSTDTDSDSDDGDASADSDTDDGDTDSDSDNGDTDSDSDDGDTDSDSNDGDSDSDSDS
ncbi:hypothetical protein [Natronorubrum texcoconense]|uniref:Uncharacterized protein n=1 Tax=Natronorubrum texcoconense TaxID=1095776 RepID=A0A1G8XVU3_9EURY|nr:hypothetical protein [Natronorubrum texcoconense]SDJ94752.1 hypothetical protein SAMN04515672_1925 [Natronorubrum texcoconense]